MKDRTLLPSFQLSKGESLLVNMNKIFKVWVCTITVLSLAWLSTESHAQSIGESMVTFLDSKINTRLGGGECSHMATEALRVSGGEFFPGDLGANFPGAGDLVWGKLVTVISYSNKLTTDSAPTVAVLPGDIIQYCSSAKIGTSSFPKCHTSVVRTVNTALASRPTAVFQQNFGGVRTVKVASIDVTKLTAGSLRIYRPISRITATNVWKFTVVNNVATSQTYSVIVGVSAVSTINLTTANTASSFRIHKVITTGTVPAVISGAASIFASNAKGNAILGSPITISQLSL